MIALAVLVEEYTIGNWTMSPPQASQTIPGSESNDSNSTSSGIKVALEESAEVLKWRTFECVVASCR